jgi:hypothetical protein
MPSRGFSSRIWLLESLERLEREEQRKPRQHRDRDHDGLTRFADDGKVGVVVKPHDGLRSVQLKLAARIEVAAIDPVWCRSVGRNRLISSRSTSY